MVSLPIASCPLPKADAAWGVVFLNKTFTKSHFLGIFDPYKPSHLTYTRENFHRSLKTALQKKLAL